MTLRLDKFVSEVERDVREGIFSKGVQVSVRHRGESVLDAGFGVDGWGDSMTSQTIHRVYCAGKPITALAVGILVDDGELSFDDQVGDILTLDSSVAIGHLTIEQLLCHEAGLFRMRGADVALVPDEMRTEMVFRERPATAGAERTAYAEFAGWHLLGLVIRTLAERPPHRFIDDRILTPLGLAGEISIGYRIGDSSFGQRVAPNLDMSETDPVPMLLSSSPECLSNREVADQTLGTMRGFGRLYQHLLDVLAGASGIVSVRSLSNLVATRGRRVDPVMRRDCAYGAGFMTDLASHSFGRRCSTQSFGHSGYRGCTAVFADPPKKLIVAMHQNGFIDAESAIQYRRPAYFNSIMSGIEL